MPGARDTRASLASGRRRRASSGSSTRTLATIAYTVRLLCRFAPRRVEADASGCPTFPACGDTTAAPATRCSAGLKVLRTLVHRGHSISLQLPEASESPAHGEHKSLNRPADLVALPGRPVSVGRPHSEISKELVANEEATGRKV